MNELLILIVIGFLFLVGYHIYKIARLSSLSPSDFPQLSGAKFNEWKFLELQSSYIFLVSLVIFWALTNVGLEKKQGVYFLIPFFVFWGGIIVAILRALKASKIKRSFEFDWRRPVQKITTAPTVLSMELEFWQSVKDSKNPDDFRAYISTYPKGQFVELAKNRVRESRKNAVIQESM